MGSIFVSLLQYDDGIITIGSLLSGKVVYLQQEEVQSLHVAAVFGVSIGRVPDERQHPSPEWRLRFCIASDGHRQADGILRACAVVIGSLDWHSRKARSFHVAHDESRCIGGEYLTTRRASVCVKQPLILIQPCHGCCLSILSCPSPDHTSIRLSKAGSAIQDSCPSRT